MAKKKNCRRTPAEQVLHREAVRLCSMTDRRLVEQFHRAAEPEMGLVCTCGSMQPTSSAGARASASTKMNTGPGIAETATSAMGATKEPL